MKKKCKGKCKQEKELTEFNKIGKSPDGRRGICRLCSTEHQKESYHRKKEENELYRIF